MIEPAANPVPSKWLRVARWVTIVGLIAACVSWCLPWVISGEFTYVPARDDVLKRPFLVALTSSVLWPFWLLAMYGVSLAVRGRQGRQVVAWVACIAMGVAFLAGVCAWAGFAMRYGQLVSPSVPGLTYLARLSPATLCVETILLLSGFLCFAIPLMRPARAAIPACVAICGAIFILDFVPGFNTLFLSTRDWALESPALLVHIPAAFLMVAGGAWEFILQRRRGEAKEKTS